MDNNLIIRNSVENSANHDVGLNHLNISHDKKEVNNNLLSPTNIQIS
jgi:hypothetical protein